MTRPSPEKLFRFSIGAQFLGVLVMAVLFFCHVPLVMSLCFPVGAGLIGLGWLAWLCMFIASL